MKFLLALAIALLSYSLMTKVSSGGKLNILGSQAVAANEAGSGTTTHKKRYYNELSCEERIIVIAPFEEFSEESLDGIAFSCAVARYLDRDNLGCRNSWSAALERFPGFWHRRPIRTECLSAFLS
jgi:hypothetical protein